MSSRRASQSSAPDRLPGYDELAVIEKTGARHAWGVFGADDELGTLNVITPEVVAAAAREVAAGEVVNYGGRDDAALDAGALGIDCIARRGLTTRGVLVDAACYLAGREALAGSLHDQPAGLDLPRPGFRRGHRGLAVGPPCSGRRGRQSGSRGAERGLPTPPALLVSAHLFATLPARRGRLTLKRLRGVVMHQGASSHGHGPEDRGKRFLRLRV